MTPKNKPDTTCKTADFSTIASGNQEYHDRFKSLKRRVFSIPTMLAFGIAIGVILFLLTRFDLDWSDTWSTLQDMNWWMYTVGFISYYTSFIFRGMRWRLLATNAGLLSSTQSRLPSTFRCSQLILIGWFVNSITWLRIGDAYRAYVFSEDSRSSFSWSLGTILAERVLDMILIFVSLVVFTMILATTLDSGSSTYIVIIAFVMALVLTSLVIAMKNYGDKLGRILPHRIENMYQRFHQGVMGSFKNFPIILLLGLAAWILEIGRLYFVIAALDLEITLALVPMVALSHAILSTVPTPGGIGAVEPGMAGLLLLALEPHQAVSITLSDRFITYLSVILIGGLVFFYRQLTLSKYQHQIGQKQ